MASQDAWARPLAKQLVDLFRVDNLDFVRVTQTYDPGTGDVTRTETVITAAGAITKTGKIEEGGTAEPHRIECWMDAEGLGDIWPNTEDELEYDGVRWKISAVEPMYSGDLRYACKVTARTT